MAKTKQIQVTVAKTFQFVQFEPSVVTVTETVEVTEADDIEKVYRKTHKRVSETVEACLIKEGERYKATKKSK